LLKNSLHWADVHAKISPLEVLVAYSDA